MKKVGLITYYGENYGGMLQAYALQRQVRQLGYECSIISNDFLYAGNTGRKQQWKNLRGLLRNPLDYMQRRKIMRKYAGERARKSAFFQKFLKTHISLDENGYACYEAFVENPPVYDIYLCGSDQIWNPNLYNQNGFYFAGFAPQEKWKIAYASSIGVSKVTPQQADFMKPYLERLDVISTRENDGAAIVEEITGRQVRTVLDPTLLLNDAQWAEVAAERLVQEPYVFCYMFGERDYYDTIKRQIKEMTGLKMVTIPFVARDFAGSEEKIYDAGPAEFISLIQHAELVITDSFHATAFSINMKTPFLSLCRFAKEDKAGMNSRLHTILQAVGLTERLIDAGDSISKEMLYDVDFISAHRKLEELRCIDSAFLKDALEGKCNSGRKRE